VTSYNKLFDRGPAQILTMARNVNNFTCLMCFYTAAGHRQLLCHCMTKHKNEANFTVQCTECIYTTNSYNAFKLHYRKKHPTINLDDCIDPTHCNNLDIDSACNETSNSMLVARYLLDLETEHKVSKTGIDAIADSTEMLLKHLIQPTLKYIPPHLQMNGQGSFSKFKSSHSRNDFYKKNCMLVEPKELLLMTSYKKVGNETKLINNYGYYIPLKEQLEALLNLPEVYRYYKNNHESPDDLMSDVCDGQYMRNHHFRAAGRSFLKLVLYYDDITLNNPLRGSNQKIGMLYMSILNIPPQFRSRLQSIFLVGCAKSRYLSKGGIHKLLNNFTSVVSTLRDCGIVMNTASGQERIYGDLIFCTADSPAAAVLAGVKESSFALKGCKACESDSREMKTQFDCSQLVLRDLQEHVERCHTLDDRTLSAKNRQFWSKQYGINCTSALLAIPDFPLTRNVLFDPVHILLEGLTPSLLGMFLFSSICGRKLFTIEWLNEEMDSYPYSYLDANHKPACIDRRDLVCSTTVKQTASGMLTLCYILPHIIGDRFPANDLHYSNFICMIQIVQLCFTPVCDTTTAGQLQQLIFDYVYLFQQLYPLASIKPKLHSLVHCVQQMIRFGSLKFTNCLRFESKHSYFKSHKWKQFLNLPKSMADKHQLHLCFQMLDASGGYSNNFVHSGDELGEGDTDYFCNFFSKNELQMIFRRTFWCDPSNELVYKANVMNIEGHKYKPGVALLLSWDNDQPEFGIIDGLFVRNQIKYFVIKNMVTGAFVHAYNAYELEEMGSWGIITHQSLRNKWPMPVFFKNATAFVTNRSCHFI
jgi:hypothetical protein